MAQRLHPLLGRIGRTEPSRPRAAEFQALAVLALLQGGFDLRVAAERLYSRVRSGNR
jgi:hypothetical protein